MEHLYEQVHILVLSPLLVKLGEFSKCLDTATLVNNDMLGEDLFNPDPHLFENSLLVMIHRRESLSKVPHGCELPCLIEELLLVKEA